MTYKYKCKDEIINVWVWDDDFHTEVSIHTKDKCYDRSIRKDSVGNFFTWNKEKIYLNDWIRISMNDLKSKVDNEEWITSDDLCQAILTDGIENARFIVSLKDYQKDDYKDVICKVQQEWNREVRSNYKLVLVPVVEDNNIQSKEDLYTMDMVGLIKSGIIKIVA